MFIKNLPASCFRPRKVTYSDLHPHHKALSARKVRERYQSAKEPPATVKVESRKGTIKSVIIPHEKPENNPLVWAKTKRIISRQEEQRSEDQLAK